jgi:hypothetical protein
MNKTLEEFRALSDGLVADGHPQKRAKLADSDSHEDPGHALKLVERVSSSSSAAISDITTTATTAAAAAAAVTSASDDGDDDSEVEEESEGEEENEEEEERGMSSYERLRQENIKRNEEFLASLGLNESRPARQVQRGSKGPRKRSTASRKSLRLVGGGRVGGRGSSGPVMIDHRAPPPASGLQGPTSTSTSTSTSTRVSTSASARARVSVSASGYSGGYAAPNIVTNSSFGRGDSDRDRDRDSGRDGDHRNMPKRSRWSNNWSRNNDRLSWAGLG